MKIRHNWSVSELQEIYDGPLLQLISHAHEVHKEHHDPGEVQVCSLISIKTGGCPEDCKYCAQSSRYNTPVKAGPLMDYEEVLSIAKEAIERGASRICLGAAWREVRDSKQFDQILAMVRGITSLGAEVCCTLGMLKEHQAQKLKEAGLHSYNHNLDTSEKYYSTIITTRTYQDRLDTLDTVQKSKIKVCCGGILGLGETVQDRLELLHALCTRDPHPTSVPINRLGPVKGTPLENQPPVSSWELIRIVATARIAMPKSIVRLSAGRLGLSYEEQALCFIAGANSIHNGEKLLTIANAGIDQDEEMFQILGLKKMQPFLERDEA